MKNYLLAFAFTLALVSAQHTAGYFTDNTPAEGETLIVGQTYTFSYKSVSSSTGNAYIVQLYNQNGGDNIAFGQFSSNPVTFSVTIPSNLADGTYNLSFIEQYNGGEFNTWSVAAFRMYRVRKNTNGGTFLPPTPVAGSTLHAGASYTFNYKSPSNPPGQNFQVFFGPQMLANTFFTSNPMSITLSMPTNLAAGYYDFTVVEVFNQGPASYRSVSTNNYYLETAKKR